MAMTRQLWSISALAVELGKDRRTVAAALDGVTADGTINGGHRGWWLSTALAALDGEIKRSGNGPVNGAVATGRCPISPAVSTTGRHSTGANRRRWHSTRRPRPLASSRRRS